MRPAFMQEISRRLSVLLGHHAEKTAIGAPTATPLVDKLPLEAQWDRVTGVVATAVEDIDTVRRLQASAEQQIDSATYALQGLLAELGRVMPLPEAVAEAAPATVLAMPQRAAEPTDDSSAIAA